MNRCQLVTGANLTSSDRHHCIALPQLLQVGVSSISRECFSRSITTLPRLIDESPAPNTDATPLIPRLHSPLECGSSGFFSVTRADSGTKFGRYFGKPAAKRTQLEPERNASIAWASKIPMLRMMKVPARAEAIRDLLRSPSLKG